MSEVTIVKGHSAGISTLLAARKELRAIGYHSKTIWNPILNESVQSFEESVLSEVTIVKGHSAGISTYIDSLAGDAYNHWQKLWFEVLSVGNPPVYTSSGLRVAYCRTFQLTALSVAIHKATTGV